MLLRRRTFTRREAIKLAGGAVVWIGYGGPTLDLGLSGSDSFDDVLDKIHTTDPELDGGLANHAPMAMEALVALEHADRVVPFADDYDEELRLLDTAPALDASERAGALGKPERRAAWIASYEAELIDGDPVAIVNRDWPMLAPGFVAATFHGLLRVGHGVRSFERQDTVSRRRELAHGLGYWAATHETLPAEPGSRAASGFDVRAAFEALPIVPRAKQKANGLIKERLGPALEDAAFVDVVERLDLDAMSHDNALAEICAAAARAFVDDGGESISLLHAITGPAALRMMWHWLDDDGRRLGLGYAFQVAAAIVSAQARSVPPFIESATLGPTSLGGAAAKSSDPHTIKLGEAAVREYQLGGRPELLRAAELWIQKKG